MNQSEIDKLIANMKELIEHKEKLAFTAGYRAQWMSGNDKWEFNTKPNEDVEGAYKAWLRLR